MDTNSRLNNFPSTDEPQDKVEIIFWFNNQALGNDVKNNVGRKITILWPELIELCSNVPSFENWICSRSNDAAKPIQSAKKRNIFMLAIILDSQVDRELLQCIRFGITEWNEIPQTAITRRSILLDLWKPSNTVNAWYHISVIENIFLTSVLPTRIWNCLSWNSSHL